jgi:hypothetical protein
MDLNKIYNALNNLAETVKTIIKTSMIDSGVDENAHIIEDLKSEAVGMDLIRVLIHDYYAYINNGSHYTQYPPPVDAIRDWCEEKLGTSDNKVVFAVREAIFQRGLKARPFMGDVIMAIDDLFDTFGDEVFEIFCEEVDKIMGK